MNRKIKIGIATGLVLAIAGVVVIKNLPPEITFPKNAEAGKKEEYRRIPFEGTRNFRDLGGYATADGRILKWGVLYRSDNLSELTRRDLKYFSRLGISHLIDFRAEFEKAENPNRLPEESDIQTIALPIFDENNELGNEMQSRLKSGNLEGFEPGEFLTEINRQLVKEYTPRYRNFIDTLLYSRGEPVLFHCTSGKDRTGFAAAIVLRILGVPMETILEDYMLSKPYSLEKRTKDFLMVRLFRGEKAAEILKVVMGVERPYLEAAFGTIDEVYGSFDNYVRDGLQMDDSEISRLKQYLLE